MSRWLLIPVTWLLFTVVMLVVGWALKRVVPAMLAPFGATIGWPAVVAVLTSLATCGLAFTFWPRDTAGRLRSPLPRRL